MANEKKKGGLTRSRLSGDVDPHLAKAGASIHFDQRLALVDIQGSLAHAKMLGSAGLVTSEEAKLLVEGLTALAEEVKTGNFPWDPDLEDVHMNLEKALTDRIGPTGAKLHTARSRNDQVALDERLYLREVGQKVALDLWSLKEALTLKAASVGDLPIPGYTHLQRAQPVLLAHHFLAYYEALKRDSGRLKDLMARMDSMPLGSGALAGTGLPIQPQLVAEELGFANLAANSLDAVASRDLLTEFLAFGAILMVHLSRLAEDIILWCSAEFGIASLPDSLTTSSSMMPQKKNPDGLELIRGKTGRTVGNLVALLTVVKGLPMSYNRDLQEDKEPFFDTVDTLGLVLPLAVSLVKGLTFNETRLQELADDPYTPATDLADHLVLKGLPFREAHGQVGALVAYLWERKVPLKEVSLKDLAKFCPLADPSLVAKLTPKALIAARRFSPGGTALERVLERLSAARAELKDAQERGGFL
ncbi:MAG: argininosuccinate lyase [Deltaproteobacteria bacterium]|jgi:argininosuccinate lyase|nr:argininosuccinate lyase [Deltaproteobacteria bacterium]